MKFNRLFSAIKDFLPDWEQRIDTVHFEFRKWLRSTMGLFFRLIALFLAVWAGHAVILAVVKYSWFLFRETQVGMSFLNSRSASTYLDIIGELDRNIILLALRLNRDALLTCLAVGLVTQFSCVRRYFYDGRGMLNHMGWFLLTVFIATTDLFELNYPLDARTGFVLYFLPVCCLLDASMTFSAKLVPEAGILFKVKDLIILNKESLPGGQGIQNNP